MSTPGHVELTEEQKENVKRIRVLESEFNEHLDAIVKQCDPRCIATAKTNIEQGCMWAVKAVTKGPPPPKQG